MGEFKIRKGTEIAVKYLRAECEVRYWEDGLVNGVEDEDGTLIPCRSGDLWCPVIDLATGVIEEWPSGIEADIHYKVCDAGEYHLLDAEKNVIASVDGYVIGMMSPGDNGYGDYVIMKIDGEGKIADWRVDLSPFNE